MNDIAAQYDFRIFALQDIPEINRLYFEEYGVNYPYPLNEEHAKQKNTIGSVALHRSELVGFARACPYAGNPRIYEFGGLIVRREHRHRAVARRLTQLRLEAVIQASATMIFSEPVCNRADRASQYNLEKRGFWHSGILPFKYPEIMLSILGHQPETVCIAFKFLSQASEIKERPIYVPPEYQPFIESILPGHPQINGYEAMRGPLPDLVWHHALSSKNQIGSTFVDVPANWPGSAACIQELRSQGFMFASLLPGFGHTLNGQTFDYITLYMPSRNDYDFDRIHVIESLYGLKNLMADEYVRSLRNASHPLPRLGMPAEIC